MSICIHTYGSVPKTLCPRSLCMLPRVTWADGWPLEGQYHTKASEQSKSVVWAPSAVFAGELCGRARP